ncbi:MAG: 1-acyl-sn-glycerol-3-phosphate acyltransferase [Verrucomicrobiales bacterium]
MAENELAEWAAEIAAKPYGERIYSITRRLTEQTLFRILDIQSEGLEHLRTSPPVIIAPVHRSNLDSLIVGTLGQRRLPTLAKESLFKIKPLGWWIAGLGAIPLDRDAADREATTAARKILDSGKPLMIFPEGTRQTGQRIGELFDGTTWIAAKTGASIVPVGIAGTETAMPPGTKRPRRTAVGVAVGAPIEMPEGRVPRSKLTELTNRMRTALQAANDRAQELIS